MGSGKSTIAKKIALKLNMPVKDTDLLIESEEDKKIADIFAENGEAYFRNIESKCILKVLSQEAAVISLGGGSILNNANLKAIQNQCFTVYLKFKPGVLAERLEKSKLKHPNKRPILHNKTGDELLTFVEKHLSEREGIYRQAHFVLDNVMDINERVDKIIEAYYNYIK